MQWHVFARLWPYLLEFKQRVALALLCLVAAKIASIGLPFVLKHTVDNLNQEPIATLAVPIALVVAYGTLRLINVLLGEVRDTLFGRVTERAMRRIGLEVFEHLHRLDLTFHLSRQTGGLNSWRSFWLASGTHALWTFVVTVSMCVKGSPCWGWEPETGMRSR